MMFTVVVLVGLLLHSIAVLGGDPTAVRCKSHARRLLQEANATPPDGKLCTLCTLDAILARWKCQLDSLFVGGF